MHSKKIVQWTFLILSAFSLMACDTATNEGSITSPVDIGTAPTTYNGYISAWDATTSGESFYVVHVSPGGTYNFTASGITTSVVMQVYRNASWSTLAGGTSGTGTLSITGISTTTETKLYIYMSNFDSTATSHTLTVN